jgi:hypothetical protein
MTMKQLKDIEKKKMMNEKFSLEQLKKKSEFDFQNRRQDPGPTKLPNRDSMTQVVVHPSAVNVVVSPLVRSEDVVQGRVKDNGDISGASIPFQHQIVKATSTLKAQQQPNKPPTSNVANGNGNNMMDVSQIDDVTVLLMAQKILLEELRKKREMSGALSAQEKEVTSSSLREKNRRFLQNLLTTSEKFGQTLTGERRILEAGDDVITAPQVTEVGNKVVAAPLRAQPQNAPHISFSTGASIDVSAEVEPQPIPHLELDRRRGQSSRETAPDIVTNSASNYHHNPRSQQTTTSSSGKREYTSSASSLSSATDAFDGAISPLQQIQRPAGQNLMQGTGGPGHRRLNRL